MYSRKRTKKGPIKSLGKGRVCKKFRCGQRLSIYNLDEFCNIHQRASFGLNY